MSAASVAMIARIWAFPGFLGSKEDWDFLKGALPAGVELVPELVDPLVDENWGVWAKRWVHEHAPCSGKREILLGYSLGGRAAMHLALEAPARFAGMLMLSAQVGISDPKERSRRVQNDYLWAQRFETEEWHQALSEWDRQPVFGGKRLPETLALRRNSARDELIERSLRQLRQLSLGLQDDLRAPLARLAIPQAWIAGEEDSRCADLVDELARAREADSSRLFTSTLLPGVSHRWPWEMPAREAARVILRNLIQMEEVKSC